MTDNIFYIMPSVLYEECTATGGAGLLGSYRELMDAMWRGDKGIVKPDRLAVS